ncbi:MAG: LamG domain-containing protein, partial [Patescibacteria group bacterium]|nr:LamG domain-containing protein [Patescibacteria group bacterium]
MSLITNISAYWKLDNNTNDSTGNHTAATLTGSPSYVTGLINQALSFVKSSGQYMDSGFNPTTYNNPFSLSLWIYPTVLAEPFAHNGYTGNADSSNGTFGWVAETTSGGNVHFEADDNGSSIIFNITSSAAVTTNAWNHIVVTYNGSGTGIIYINGSSSGTGSGTAGGTAPINNLQFANYWNGTTDAASYDGYIDEIGLWS